MIEVFCFIFLSKTELDFNRMWFQEVGNFEFCGQKILLEWLFWPAFITQNLTLIILLLSNEID